MRKKWLFLGPLAVLAFIGFIALGGEVVRLLWNWLVPSLFGFRQITFWQALALLALCRILFGGFGWKHSHRSPMGRRMAERWSHMTPEERERFRQNWRNGRGFCSPAEKDAQV